MACVNRMRREQTYAHASSIARSGPAGYVCIASMACRRTAHLFSPLISNAVIVEAQTGRNEVSLVKNVWIEKRKCNYSSAPNSCEDNFSRIVNRQTIKHYLSPTQSKVNCAARHLFFLLLFYLPQKYAPVSLFLFDPFLSPPARLPCVPFGSHLLTQWREMLISSIQMHVRHEDTQSSLMMMMMSNAPIGKCRTRENARKQQEKQPAATAVIGACLRSVFTVAHHYTTFGLLFIAQIHWIIKCNRIVFKCL